MNNNELEDIAKNLIKTTELAGKKSIEIQEQGLKIITKPDNSPVTNGDLEVNKMITEKIKNLTPNIPIISEETVDLKKKNTLKTFWLIDPIDGTKEYIAGKDEYTINAALVLNYVPTVGLLGAPKKNRLFYSYGKNNSFMIEGNKTIKLDCKKKTTKGKIFAVSGAEKPAPLILDVLKKHRVESFTPMHSSYKFCVIATGEFDFYAAKERAYEWDYAAGHAIAESAGAIITTLDNQPFRYGKSDYKNLSLIIKRNEVLDA
ncbi:3'(2'),5'-bisphosphate nucleotidase CysQ [Pelagibacterales bacterium SAG-MED29]|nr:3'(2'),5'-bisphosphate nucleotidase CysQ [Pelagibacterales bacterium SAG-MED29]